MKSVNSKNWPALARRAATRRARLAAPLLALALACALLAGGLPAAASAAAQDAGQKRGGASPAASEGKGAGSTRARAARPEAEAKPAGLKTGGGGAVPFDAIGCTKPEQPITINGGTANGFLGDANDCQHPDPQDDTFYDAYTFQGTAGQYVIITMNTTSGIDPYVYLVAPGENTLSYRTLQNDDLDPDDPDDPNDSVNINSQLFGVLPTTGTYTIVANLFPPTPSNPNRPTTGSYTLSVSGGCVGTLNIGAGTRDGALGGVDCRMPDNTSVFNPNALVDVYSFTVQAGQPVSISMTSTALDSYLFLLSTDGFTPLAENDDGLSGGGENNSQRGARIPAPLPSQGGGAGSGLAVLPGAGTYYILASAFAQGQSGGYQLTLTLGSNCGEQPIGAGQSANGTLALSDCRLALDSSAVDVYTFQGTAGQQINVTMTSTQFDPFLLLFDPAGYLIYEDNNGAGTPNARIPHPDDGQFLTLPVTGTYRIYANAAAPGQIGSYTISVGSSTVNCTVTLPQASRQNVPSAGGQFTDNYTSPAGCAAPAVASNAAWITNVTANAAQGTFAYTVAQNTTAQSRTGTITVGGQTFTVTQLAGCPVGLSPTVAPFAQAGGAGRFTVAPDNNAQCAWAATETADWITINTGATGTGTARVTYTVAPNNTGSTRTATITVNGQTHTVTQLSGAAPTVAFKFPTFSVNESNPSRSITVTVTRLGDTAGASTVEYRTLFETAEQSQIPCNPALTRPDGTPYPKGAAFERCDFATTIDTLTFAPGETEKSFTIPLINDVHVEGNETFQVELANAQGATLGAQTTATVTIIDDDTTAPTQNPVRPPLPYGPESPRFFVRMQYLDFLSREPEAGEPWTAVIANCPNPENRPEETATASADCDRIRVSQAFFESDENRIKGRFVFFYHKATFGAADNPNYFPAYRDFVTDLRRVTGQTAAETLAKRLDFAESWVTRPEFVARYGAKSNEQFVNEVLANVNTTPTQAGSGFTAASLIADLNAGTRTRAEVLRLIVDSPEVSERQFNHAYVAMQYYNYLRRTPDLPGYLAWLNAINQNRNNLRVMVDGFMNSTEYVFRFGPN